jgi:hypothetical protein
MQHTFRQHFSAEITYASEITIYSGPKPFTQQMQLQSQKKTTLKAERPQLHFRAVSIYVQLNPNPK